MFNLSSDFFYHALSMCILRSLWSERALRFDNCSSLLHVLLCFKIYFRFAKLFKCRFLSLVVKYNFKKYSIMKFFIQPLLFAPPPSVTIVVNGQNWKLVTPPRSLLEQDRPTGYNRLKILNGIGRWLDSNCRPLDQG